ncbi:hypothetical protein Tco_0853883 [Tanacetum coccineum]
MEPNEILKSGGEGFIDRSKVRILLCDNDMKSSVEVYDLLCKCSYQVMYAQDEVAVVVKCLRLGAEIIL